MEEGPGCATEFVDIGWAVGRGGCGDCGLKRGEFSRGRGGGEHTGHVRHVAVGVTGAASVDLGFTIGSEYYTRL